MRDRCQVVSGWPALQAALGLEGGQILGASVVLREPLKVLFTVVEQHPQVSLLCAARTSSRSQLYQVMVPGTIAFDCVLRAFESASQSAAQCSIAAMFLTFGMVCIGTAFTDVTVHEFCRSAAAAHK